MNDQNGDKNPLWMFLDRIEELAIKMILGIFRFTFIKIPSFIKDFFVEWFPTLLKLIRVLVLLSVWILMILAPFMYLSFNFYREHDEVAFGDIAALNGLSTEQILIVVIWGGVGIVGSVWGIFYITKTRLNLLGRIKSLFSRKQNS